MPLQRGKVLGYDFNRMVVDFTSAPLPSQAVRIGGADGVCFPA
jgi:hypothetical protein